ncbi:MAG TPA: hypothetical protein VL943_14405, partial [Niabella sp.]|nr:hypothetical protein [Niabella sp.]
VQYSDDYDNDGQISESFSNTDIAFSPNAVAGAVLTFEPFTKPESRQHFYFDLLEKYVGRQYLDNSQNKLRSINPYALTDARFRYQFSSNVFKDISIILMVNNVFNKKYENNGYTYTYLYDGVMTTENYYFTQAGTNWNVGVTFGF